MTAQQAVNTALIVDTAPPPCGWPECPDAAEWIARMPGCRHTLLRCRRHYLAALKAEALNHRYYHPGCAVRAEWPPRWGRM